MGLYRQVIYHMESDLFDKKNREFFQTVTVSVLLYGRTIWSLTSYQPVIDNPNQNLTQIICTQ